LDCHKGISIKIKPISDSPSESCGYFGLFSPTGLRNSPLGYFYLARLKNSPLGCTEIFDDSGLKLGLITHFLDIAQKIARSAANGLKELS
jgi:hypothetical protein